MCRAYLACFVSALGFAASAQAAEVSGYKDAISMPVPDWNGPYAGINGGFAISAFSDQLARTNISSGTLFGGLEPKGAFGGGQIGYNWRNVFGVRSLVFGAEADLEAGQAGEKFRSSVGPRTSIASLDDFGTAQARFGVALDHTLLYLTGGLAYGQVANKYTDPANTTKISGIYIDRVFSVDKDAVGYVVGAGLEYKLASSVSLKAEYQYFDLGEADPLNSAGVSYKATYAGTVVRDDAFHTFRAGLNFHFLPAYEALK
jgi:outer membrane immunogenic protein